jgi:elongation factor Tu
MVITSPGYIRAYKRFTAAIYILKAEDGGRTRPFHDRQIFSFYFRIVELTGEVIFPPGVKEIRPGDSLTVNINLTLPIALNIGLRFAIRENNKTIGIGQVIEISY